MSDETAASKCDYTMMTDTGKKENKVKRLTHRLTS